MTFPNLIIAGAPKCGTSSLYGWLVDHPDVCGAIRKETFYLIDCENPLLRPQSNYHAHGLKGYERHFAHCVRLGSAGVVVEATTHYIYQITAREVLRSLPSQPKIVFVLRRPADRTLSSFLYAQNNLATLRKDLTFASYVELARKRSPELRRYLFNPENVYVPMRDIQYSRYARYLVRWYEDFGEDRIRVLLFENLKRDPVNAMRGVADLVGIDSSFYDRYTFGRHNESVFISNQRIHRAVRRLGRLIPALRVRRYLVRQYLRRQGGGQPSRHLSAEDQSALTALEHDFEPDNRRLAELCNLDLSAWSADRQV